MKRVKRQIALLLAAALVLTSINMPVYAKEMELDGENVVSGNETVVSQNDSVSTNEGIETTTDELLEFIQDDVSGDKATYIENGTVYVRKTIDAFSALAGTGITEDTYTIQLMEPVVTPNLPKYKIMAGDIDLNNGITLPEKKNITLNLGSYGFAVDAGVTLNASEFPKLVVPVNTTLTITGDVASKNIFPFQIINSGTLILMGGTQVAPYYGYGVYNAGSLTIEDLACVNFKLYLDANKTISPIFNGNTGKIVINSEDNLADACRIFNNGKSDYTLINEGGEVIVESGRIAAEGASASAIHNIGSTAVTELRGGVDYNMSNATVESENEYGIINYGGRVSVGNNTEFGGKRVFIKGERAGILNIGGGHLYQYNGKISSGQIGVINTSFATTDYNIPSIGSFIMMNGEIEADEIGIAYSAANLSTLNMGKVYGGATGAVVRYSAANTVDPVITSYAFINSKGDTVGAYDSTPAKTLKTITNGLVSYSGYQDKSVATSIATYQNLLDAAATGGDYILESDISLEGNLIIAKNLNLNLNDYVITGADADDKITINASVSANFMDNRDNYDSYDDSQIQFNHIADNESGIVNNGILYMNEVEVIDGGGASSHSIIRNNASLTLRSSCVSVNHAGASVNSYTNGIYNAATGICNLTEDSIVSAGTGGYASAIYNLGSLNIKDSSMIQCVHADENALMNEETGVVVMNSYYSSIISGFINSTAVYNKGTFTLKDGLIECGEFHDYRTFAIVYEGNHYPIILGGNVLGSNDGSDTTVSANDFTRGTAVVKMANAVDKITEMGYILQTDAVGAVAVSAKNTCRIFLGQIRSDSILFSKNRMLVQVNETMDRVAENFFYGDSDYIRKNLYEITSSDPTIVSLTKEASGEYSATALKAGLVTLKLKLLSSGISDYLTIEVVDNRANLTADSYQGSLIYNSLLYNAYKSNVKIPMEWHLKSSYVTSTGSSADVLNNTFSPDRVYIDDAEFNKYFELDDSNSYGKIQYDKESKKMSFYIYAIEQNGTNQLVADGIKNINNVDVKLEVTNETSGKPEYFSIGKLNITIDQSVPKATFSPITLNSAYIAGEGDNIAKISNYITAGSLELDSIERVSYPENFSCDIGGGGLVYTGEAKSCAVNIPMTVKYNGYNGEFSASVPVKVVNNKPKADFKTKQIVVAKNTASSSDIPIYLTGKNEKEIKYLKNAEIVGKSNFQIVDSILNGNNSTYINNNKAYGNSPSFYIQPRGPVTKAETITIRFKYAKLNTVKGKEYSFTTKLKITPSTSYSMKLLDKEPLCKGNHTTAEGYKMYDYASVHFETTPSNFNGAYFKITEENGNELTGIKAGEVEKDEGSLGRYYLKLYATDDTKNLTGNVKNIKIGWYGEDGKLLGKEMTVPVSLYDQSELTLTSHAATINIDQDSSIFFSKKISLDKVHAIINKMTASIPVNASYNWYESSTSNVFFEADYDEDEKILRIVPELNALLSGVLRPGKTYDVDVKFRNTLGELRTETVKITIAQVKKYNCEVSCETLYKNSPITQSYITVKRKPSLAYLAVKNMEIATAGSPFEICASIRDGKYNQGLYIEQSAYAITFKNNVYNKNIKAVNKVPVKITFDNGLTTIVNLKVNVK